MAEEKRVDEAVKRILASYGCYIIKTHGDRYSVKGTPDIIACYKGRFIALEDKATNGKPSKLQCYHLKKVSDSGGFGSIIVPTAGINKIKNYIHKYFPEYSDTNVLDLDSLKTHLDNL